MSKEMDFFIYLLEHYAYSKHQSAGDVLRRWDEAGVTDEIFDGFFQYHQEALEHAYADIDSLLETGEHALA